MTIDCAQSSEEAIQTLCEKAALCDLVFMDHMMPDIDGPVVLKTLRDDINGKYARSLPANATLMMIL